MKRIKVSDNFFLDEFINKTTYNKFEIKSSRYIRPELITAAQLFRDLTGESVTICNWATGGSYNESGLRDFNTSTGAKYSMHKFTQAIDIKCGKMTSWEMYNVIKDNWSAFYKIGIRRVEHPDYTQTKNGKLGRDWLHIDMANDLSFEGNDINVIIP